MHRGRRAAEAASRGRENGCDDRRQGFGCGVAVAERGRQSDAGDCARISASDNAGCASLWGGVGARVAQAAAAIYKLQGQPDRLRVLHPECPHDFPPETRQRAYEFLDQHLRSSPAKTEK